MENVRWIIPTSNYNVEYGEYYFVDKRGNIELCKVYNDVIYNYNFTRQLGEFYNQCWYNLKFQRAGCVDCLDNYQGLFSSFETAWIAANFESLRLRTVYYVYVDENGKLQRAYQGEMYKNKYILNGDRETLDIVTIKRFMRDWDNIGFDKIFDFDSVLTVYYKSYKPDGLNLVRI